MTTPSIRTIPLSPRLETVAEFVPRGARVADVCTDHALLAAFIACRDDTTVIATDRAPSAIRSARASLQRLGLDDRVDLRVGEGLAPVRADEVDTIVIAGVGTRTMEVVLANIDDEPTVTRLVLQSNTEVPRLRHYMATRGWTPDAERLVTDDGQWYWVQSFVAGASTARYTALDWWLGFDVRRDQPELLTAYLAEKERRWTLVRDELTAGTARRRHVEARLATIRIERRRLTASRGRS